LALNAVLPRARLGRWLRLAVACALAAYATGLLIGGPFTSRLLSGSPDGAPLGDFGSFYASAQAAARGLDPFDVYPLTMDADLGRGTGAAVNLNAPLSVLVFQPLTLLDPAVARLGWFVATIIAYAAIVGLLGIAYPLSRGPLHVIWPFAMAGFWETVSLGQVYAFLALLSTLAWLLLRRRPVLAGMLIGFVAAFKPNFFVWPVLLVLAGQRRVGVTALIASVSFGLLPVVSYGPRVYGQWLTAIRLEQVNGQVANASIAGLLVRLGQPQWLALFACTVTLVGLSLWAWLRRPSLWKNSTAALLGLLLASPIGWVGYTVFLLPLFAVVRGSLALVVAAGLLCIPRLVLQQWADAEPTVRMTIGAAYTVGWLLLGYELRHLGQSEPSTDTT